jgi:hypothetical protein
MKIGRLLIRSFPWIAACTVASAAAVWSPISCGCVDAWQSIASGIGRDDLKSANGLTAQIIADAISHQLSGKTVTIRDLPFSTSTYDCAMSTSPTRTIRCRWWIWESDYDQKGFDVIVFTTTSGIFKRVSVIPVQYIQSEHSRVTPNNSFKPKPLRGSA